MIETEPLREKIYMKPWNNVTDLLQQVEKSYNNPHALNGMENGKWVSWTTSQALQDIKNLALGLRSLGIKKGTPIGLMALPSPKWTLASFAIQMAGGVLVTIFPNISEENFIHEINETDLKTIFVENLEPHPLIERHRDSFTLVIEMGSNSQDETVLTYNQLIERGKQLGKNNPDLYSQLSSSIQDEDLGAIVYTSATTGIPKGVMLTHKNLVRHLSDTPFEIIYKERVLYLNILPLAHIFGYLFNMLIFGFGGSVYYMNDVKNFGAACQELHPNILAVVPRLLEKVYAKMLAGLQKASFLKRSLGEWAFDLAKQEKETLYKHMMHPLADKLVYTKLREALGGNLKIVISGGAALNPHLNHFFQDVGVPIFEGWGMTEACPVTVNRLGHNKIGFVGQVFSNWQIKLSPEGEILVQGTGVMKGYYKNPEATAKTIDKEGWLHTGDKGEIDEEGYLKILGRIKELYKTSTGEYVAPVPIEQELTKAPLIEMAMIIADGKKFVSVLFFPNKDVLDSIKAAHQATNKSDEEFLNSEFVRKEMDNLLSSVNKHLNPWEQIHAYSFIPHSPSIEAGELTPSMKLRREVIMKKYKNLVDAMYPEEIKDE